MNQRIFSRRVGVSTGLSRYSVAMAMLVKDRARLDAADVLRDTWTAGYPVDPERIATNLGLVVRRIPLENGVSGMIQAEPGFDAEIFVNSNDTPQRQRFTIAHELGHYYERTSRGFRDFNFIDYRSNDHYDLHEFYADEFAGALLMPRQELDSILKERSISGAAMHFDVSLAAVKKRLERLEL